MAHPNFNPDDLVALTQTPTPQETPIPTERNCHHCAKPIDPDRLEALPDTTQCIRCARKYPATTIGYMVFGHKTGPELVVLKNPDEETKRLADNAHNRAR